MSWYNAICGSWQHPESVRRIDGTYDREKAFSAALELANETGMTVTVTEERGSAAGLRYKFYTVEPEVKA